MTNPYSSRFGIKLNSNFLHKAPKEVHPLSFWGEHAGLNTHEADFSKFVQFAVERTLGYRVQREQILHRPRAPRKLHQNLAASGVAQRPENPVTPVRCRNSTV